MTCKQGQGRPVQILTPIPDAFLPDAARLWCNAFAPRSRQVGMRADHGIAAVARGQVVGICGLRDAGGGFPMMSMRGGFAFRAAPQTSDLVLDGLVVAETRQGIGRALVMAAARQAGLRGHPGLRAEVRIANRPAMAFYRALGFVEVTRGRFGWPWGGQVAVLHLPVDD